MNTTTKILTAAIVVPSIMTLGLVNVSANANQNTLDAQAIQEFETASFATSFADMKKTVIEELASEMKYAPQEIQNQMASDIKALKSLEKEDDFFKAVDSIDEKLLSLYSNIQEVSLPETFDAFKAELIKDAEAELKNITDTSLRGSIEQEIKDLKAIKTEKELDALFDRYFEEAMQAEKKTK